MLINGGLIFFAIVAVIVAEPSPTAVTVARPLTR